jgi:hypothetical protein
MANRDRQGGFERWWWVVGVHNDQRQWIVSRGCSTTASSGCGIGHLPGARLLVAVAPGLAARATVTSFDRVLMRLLGAGRHLVRDRAGLARGHQHRTDQSGHHRGAGVRRGHSRPAQLDRRGLPGSTQGGILDRIKPYVPQILAYVTWYWRPPSWATRWSDSAMPTGCAGGARRFCGHGAGVWLVHHARRVRPASVLSRPHLPRVCRCVQPPAASGCRRQPRDGATRWGTIGGCQSSSAALFS